MENKNPTALHLKEAAMSYFRYNRQWLCATECLNKDVLVMTNKDFIEVEIKVSKSDLWNGESKKFIHHQYKEPEKWAERYMLPNRYYICVPEYLLEEAKKWVQETNTKYGILLYNNNSYQPLIVVKTAKVIHNRKQDKIERPIMMRICSENILHMRKNLRGEK